VQLVLRATARAEPARLELRPIGGRGVEQVEQVEQAEQAEPARPAEELSGTVLPEPTELSFTLKDLPRGPFEVELQVSAPVLLEAVIALAARAELPPPEPLEPEPTATTEAADAAQAPERSTGHPDAQAD
jgi:hypothetical protein